MEFAWHASKGFGGDQYEIKGDAVTITGCDKKASGELIIAGMIEGKPVTKIGEVAFQDCTSLASITIPDSVTSIGGGAFYDCFRLRSITDQYRSS